MPAVTGLPSKASEDESLPAAPSFCNIIDKLGNKVTDSATSQAKDQLIIDLITQVRKNRQLLNEHTFVITELKDRKPCAGTKMFRHTYGVTDIVDKLIAAEAVKSVLNLRPTQSSTNRPAINIFGFTDMSFGSFNSSATPSSCDEQQPATLPFHDALILQAMLEEGLIKKCRCIIEEHDLRKAKLPVTRPACGSCPTDTKLIFFHKINSEMHEMNALSNKEYSSYHDMIKLRVHISDIVQKKTSCLKQQVQSLVLKNRAVELKVTKGLYMDHPNVWEAINKIHSHLETETATSRSQLQKLQSDEESHKEMAKNEAYNRILTEYKEVQKLIRQKKVILRRF